MKTLVWNPIPSRYSKSAMITSFRQRLKGKQGSVKASHIVTLWEACVCWWLRTLGEGNWDWEPTNGSGLLPWMIWRAYMAFSVWPWVGNKEICFWGVQPLIKVYYLHSVARGALVWLSRVMTANLCSEFCCMRSSHCVCTLQGWQGCYFIWDELRRLLVYSFWRQKK